MRCAIVTLYDEHRKQFGDITSAAAKQYCGAHGYRFACYTQSLERNRPANWSKLIALLTEFEKGEEWLLWIDADALIVQPRYRLEEIIKTYHYTDMNILFSSDNNGLCSGVFLIRNCEWSKIFLQTVLFLGDMPGSLHLQEQKTIQTLWDTFPDFKNKTVLLPDSLIQNPESTFNPSAFIMHYWAGTHDARKIEDKLRSITYHGWQEAFF